MLSLVIKITLPLSKRMTKWILRHATLVFYHACFSSAYQCASWGLPLQFMLSLVAKLESNMKEYDEFTSCLCTRDPLCKSYNLKWVSPMSLVSKVSKVTLSWSFQKSVLTAPLCFPLISGKHKFSWFVKKFPWNRWWWNGDKENNNQSFLSVTCCLFIYPTKTFWVSTILQSWTSNSFHSDWRD